VGPLARQARSAGFTLIEVLVVVVLVAITASLVVVSMRQDDRALVREEAVRLAESFRHVQDEAILTGTTFGWRGEPRGYEYLRRTPDRQWLPLQAEGGTTFVRRLPESVRLVDVEVNGVKVDPGMLVLVSPSGTATNARVVLEASRDRAFVEIGAVPRVVMQHGS
jgi:general secretion pathway protein H